MSHSVDEHHAASRLAQWFAQTIGLPKLQVRFRLRGNVLHVLCEGNPLPPKLAIALPLVKAMQTADIDINHFLPTGHPPLYQVILYARLQGQSKPGWAMPIYLNQLDQHLNQLRHLQEETLATVPAETVQQPGRKASQSRKKDTSAAGSSALVLPTRSLAKRGTPEGIALYLSEVLNGLGVSVRVNVKSLPIPKGAQVASRRLWILCEAPYSPDPAAIAEPTAQRLRDLELEGFRDAVVLIQVQGEPHPDWFLRVDLTPPVEMLREWARWGDVAAIARLVAPVLADLGAEATAELRGTTLHLFCQATVDRDLPKQAVVHEAIAPLLDTLAPQGIHAVTLYGQRPTQNSPDWVDWIDLPAAEHPALASSTWEVAQQGDLPALSFLLTRRLNPDIDHQLATGGIRLRLLYKADLLHIMADAPVCPKQRQVGPPLVQIIRQLQIPACKGVRIYGRRAGQKLPLWSYGIDFQARHRLIPEAAPDFAASDTYVGDLLSRSQEEAMLRPELTIDDVQTQLAQLRQRLVHGLQKILVRSQIFVLQGVSPDALPSQPAQSQRRQTASIALVWGTVGLLLMVQIDWILGQILTPPPAPLAAAETLAAEPSPEALAAESDLPWDLSELSFGRSAGAEADGFGGDGFTSSTSPAAAASISSSTDLAASPTGDWVDLSTIESPYATFNSYQLDDKVALYHKRLAESGPPDVLILGSSRALRGVDPAALEQSLAAVGYEDVSVFNFGINGATAQVVDYIIREVLTTDQLPKLILFADGARAFNSGRVDITYNAIAVSEGYQEIANRLDPVDPTESDLADPETASSGNQKPALFTSYADADQQLRQAFSQLSAAYEERERLKEAIQKGVAQWLGPNDAADWTAAIAEEGATVGSDPLLAQEGEAMVDFDGFLPLSVQFNPATYYQKHPRVSGVYDGDYDDFTLEGKQADAFQALLDFTQTQNIPVIFVNTPLTDEYLDPARAEHEQAFQQWMLQLAATEPGLIFRDLGQLWTQQYDYFSDPSHLNRYGAYQVSNRLAQDPMIPWLNH